MVPRFLWMYLWIELIHMGNRGLLEGSDVLYLEAGGEI